MVGGNPPPQPIRLLLPAAPASYDQAYLNQLVRAIVQATAQMQGPQNLQAVSMLIYDFPTDPYGLPVGTVYVDSNGFLKVALTNAAYVGPLTIASALGTVTATGT